MLKSLALSTAHAAPVFGRGLRAFFASPHVGRFPPAFHLSPFNFYLSILKFPLTISKICVYLLHENKRLSLME